MEGKSATLYHCACNGGVTVDCLVISLRTLLIYNNVQTSAVLQTPAEVAVGTGQCLLTAAAARQPRTTRRTNSVFPPPAEWCGD